MLWVSKSDHLVVHDALFLPRAPKDHTLGLETWSVMELFFSVCVVLFGMINIQHIFFGMVHVCFANWCIIPKAMWDENLESSVEMTWSCTIRIDRLTHLAAKVFTMFAVLNASTSGFFFQGLSWPSESVMLNLVVHSWIFPGLCFSQLGHVYLLTLAEYGSFVAVLQSY